MLAENNGPGDITPDAEIATTIIAKPITSCITFTIEYNEKIYR